MDVVLFLKALAAGERWISVRPNGPGTKAQPVLVKPTPDGAMKVIGGAGGALNHLKLTGVKSEAAYREEAGKKVAAGKALKKERRARDKELGLTQNKSEAKAVVKEALQGHEAAFVQDVAAALGWGDDQLRFPEEKWQNATAKERTAAVHKHAKALLKRAKEAVDLQRQRLLNDAGARAEADLGEVALDAPATELGVQDLDPIKPSTGGFGFAANYRKRAEAAGLKDADLKAEAEAAKPPPAPGKPAAARAERIRDELQAVRDPGPVIPPAELLDVKRAVGLLKAEKALKGVEKERKNLKRR